MSRKERVKESIVTFRAFALAFTTAIFGASGFLVIHFKEIENAQAIIISAGLVILAVLFCGTAIYLKKLLDELENFNE